jgi:hypothetical protein
MHCSDPNCSGGGESITSPDGAEYVGQYTSLELDGAGNPVISYQGNVSGIPGLKIMHCNDPNCAGDDESITAPDTTFGVGEYTSLELDSSGNPVVSYHDSVNRDLKVLHCSDANCAAGGDTITAPDNADEVGLDTSLALDTSGNPVISYYDLTNSALKVMHCNDANCAGSNEAANSPDTGGNVGLATSLALDASGNPVVSYYDQTNFELKVLHCDDANCAPGGDSFTFPDGPGFADAYTSLVLDALGRPVVAYQDFTGDDPVLNVLHCNDANCAGNDESIETADASPNVANYLSMALDSSGRPVVSHWDVGPGGSETFDLKVLHCGNANCSKAPPKINITNIGQYALPKSCFEVRDAAQTPVFTVCDNDFQGEADVNAACTGDNLCNDEDPAPGSVSVTVAGDDYRVVESAVAPEHIAVTGKLVCNTIGGDCNLTFVNTPDLNPWHPWDLTSPSGHPDGLVRVIDILDVVAHFFIDKPLPTPTPTP